MGEGVIVFIPRLRLARAQALGALANISDKARGLALPYPVELARTVRAYVKGKVSWEDVKLRLRRLLGVYGGIWLKIEEPLLRGLKELGFADLVFTARARGIVKGFTSALELLAYALRLRLGAAVNPSEVYSLTHRLRPYIGFEPGLAARGYAVIVDSLRIAQVLAESFRLVNVMPGYVETPLEELIWAGRGEVLEALRRYTNFVFNYLTTSRDLDEAYLRWVVDEYPESYLAREARKLLLLLRGGSQSSYD